MKIRIIVFLYLLSGLKSSALDPEAGQIRDQIHQFSVAGNTLGKLRKWYGQFKEQSNHTAEELLEARNQLGVLRRKAKDSAAEARKTYPPDQLPRRLILLYLDIDGLINEANINVEDHQQQIDKNNIAPDQMPVT
ncbi:Hypothetical protein NTJ_10225 [Nesidiocoris tenuis]|uniref:Uncharacterized protein n=1 Tax=Nesidiocoris tenuis TaxID=355587 RepID=A0ABN7B2M8_9HEMI|nr:Hypothetical protein NTJ_10225 [Nesidiocoris tenuis]